MIRLVLCIAMVLATAIPAVATEPSMTRITFRRLHIGKGEPVTVVRAGSKYQWEETGIFVMITAMPEVWGLTPSKKDGWHSRFKKDGPFRNSVPPGKTVEAHPALASFEWGHEIAFFEEHGARTGDTRTVDVDGLRLRLDLDPKTHTPAHITIYQKGLIFDSRIAEYAIDSYQPDLPFDPALFKPPPGYKLEETPPIK